MKQALPVITLVVMAPVVAELFSASTPLADVVSLLFFLPMYGAGALLVRELVWRNRRGWLSILLLGLAYGLVEEGLVVQAIFNPTAVQAASWGAQAGGYLLGIYGVFALAVISYHAIWSIALPILLTELLFPTQWNQPYLGRGGLIATAICYMLGVLIVGSLVHTRIAPGPFASPILLGATVCLVVVLAVLALLVLPKTAARPEPPRAPSPWIVLLISALGSFTFLALLIFPGRVIPIMTHGALVLIPISSALAVILLIGWRLSYWTAAHNWNYLHALALASSLLLVNPLIALLQGGGSTQESMGLVVLEGVAIAFLSGLLIRFRAQETR
ncbi:hypothetical protein KSF_075660 [Reticulibacter mediterranei]|uniref:Uncharacterized protein n=1 Tax=Reticulibacter mediterranei TaxID=2778369 RepID=A0A8J3IP02_9CHLR|nr:hypothetical protein [Reticulibacter mediterranei]GHO97518.1 hypothetical protein KSF_075660 [Reticulibacter mediterranei]